MTARAFVPPFIPRLIVARLLFGPSAAAFAVG